jgi:hypothetical protein
MGPLNAEHPLVRTSQPCAACTVPFQEGELVTLIPLGPGDDPEDRRKCREGKAYNSTAAVVHWACATGEE